MATRAASISLPGTKFIRLNICPDIAAQPVRSVFLRPEHPIFQETTLSNLADECFNEADHSIILTYNLHLPTNHIIFELLIQVFESAESTQEIVEMIAKAHERCADEHPDRPCSQVCSGEHLWCTAYKLYLLAAGSIEAPEWVLTSLCAVVAACLPFSVFEVLGVGYELRADGDIQPRARLNENWAVFVEALQVEGIRVRFAHRVLAQGMVEGVTVDPELFEADRVPELARLLLLGMKCPEFEGLEEEWELWSCAIEAADCEAATA